MYQFTGRNGFMKPSIRPDRLAAATLFAAKQLISDPQKWGQQSFAINEKGENVDVFSPDACRFCALGAIFKVSGSYHKATATDYLHEVCRGPSPMAVNDVKGHEETLRMFDEAIELAEKGRRK